MILQDMDHGHGLALLDPHGDLSADIRRAVPEHRKDDFIDFEYRINGRASVFKLKLQHRRPVLT